jgi:hypothetical protein
MPLSSDFIKPSLEEYTVPVVSIKREMLCGLILTTETGIFISVLMLESSELHDERALNASSVMIPYFRFFIFV